MAATLVRATSSNPIFVKHKTKKQLQVLEGRFTIIPPVHEQPSDSALPRGFFAADIDLALRLQQPRRGLDDAYINGFIVHIYHIETILGLF